MSAWVKKVTVAMVRTLFRNEVEKTRSIAWPAAPGRSGSPELAWTASHVADRPHLVDRRHTLPDLLDAVLPQRAHAFAQSRLLQCLGACPRLVQPAHPTRHHP